MPRFTSPRQTLGEVFPGLATDATILIVVTLASFVGAAVAFSRYDVR